MHCLKNLFQKTLVLFCLSLILLSCHGTKEAPPFPLLENEYAQPEVKALTIPKPDTIQWESKVLPGLKSIPTTKFDYDKLPSKPFDIGLSYPLNTPLTTESFDWSALPNEPFYLDSLPKKNLKVKVSVLGEPRIVKAGNFVNAGNATRGVMTLDANFGLPSTPYSQLIDSEGSIWFALSSGIARYDSENLEIYGVEQGVEGKFINWIHEDAKGRIWMVGNQGTLSVLDRKSNLAYELTSSFPVTRKFTIKEDANGIFWITDNGNGIYIVDLENKIIRNFGVENGLLSKFNFEILVDSKGKIWITTGNGFNMIDLENNLNTKYDSKNLISISEDKKERIWLVTANGINILNKNRNEASFLSKENLDHTNNSFLTSAFEDENGHFWIGTNNGNVYKYDEKEQTLNTYFVKPTTNGAWMYNFFEDQQGQIWTACGQGGVFKIDKDGYKPGNYITDDGLGDNNVWATLEASDGMIWIGTHGGIDIYDPINNSIKHLGLEQGLVHLRNTNLKEDSKGRIWAGGNQSGVSIIDLKNKTIQKLTDETGIKSHRITSTMEGIDGSIWLSSFIGEIQAIDLDKGLYKRYIDNDTIVQKSRKDRIIQTEKNIIWVADQEYGLHKMDLEKNMRWRFTTENGLISNLLYSIGKDHKNRIWIASDKGVQIIDENELNITTFTTNEGLGANDVYDVIEKDKKMYLGTSKGLTILEKEEGETALWKVKTIGKNQGLDYIDFCQNSISFDRNGRLWAGAEGQILTVMDIPKIDTVNYAVAVTSINIFDESLKFRDNEFLQKKYNEIDTLWQYEKNDFVLRQKTEIDSSYQITHNITWETVEGSYDLPTKLTLPADQNYLSFNYNGRQFNNPDKVVYRYILEGIDKKWSPITTNTTSENYRDLPPGDYTFKVAAKGFNGIWSKPATFSFKITPPWWQTWWAYTLYALLGLTLAYFVHKMQKARTIRIEREKSKDKELEQAKEIEKAYTELKETQNQLIQSEKMASLGELTAGIAHEIQNPMNFINNFSEVSSELMAEMVEELDKGEIEEAKLISKDIIQNLEKIGLHGKRASSIVKGMLEHSRNSSGKKELIDINVLADEYLRLAYHGLRAKDKSFNSDFKTDLDESLPKVEIIPQDLGRVILNLINNAFYAVTARAESGEENYKPLVTVTTKNLKDQVLIKIKDNGTGIPPELKDKIFQPFFTTKPTGKGTGLGLSLAYDIVTTGHGGAIELDTKTGEGTEFSIYIPIQKD
ncbi:two-component regulator propeller domain-containing protein [Namhaeicola litoreus]|uniref:histidine kinase n=1 Tax=Namhaeicola litoreus TaxID=1052145 RepID=A0ABW3Y151_9FLAO